MNWGNSLLWSLFSDAWDGLMGYLSEATYALWSGIWGILYKIWHLLAWLVDKIEGVFRNLAGIGSSGGDMVTVIINNPKVGQIFGNLVGMSMALIVFFTIVKIIQDHYKEKDGGNPYKIVLRTFQGLLMFFFISAAVSVGLYASQIMFKALDAATGTGSSSIAGQIFKTMAADANRKKLGLPSGGLTQAAKEKYWYKVEEGNATHATEGKYFVTTLWGGNTANTSAELESAYEAAFPASQWGVVNADGSVTPVLQWMNGAGSSLSTQSDWSQYKGSGSKSGSSEGNHSAGSAGYENDLLRGVDVVVTPSVDFTWSPIDIVDFGYYLKETNKIQHDINVTVWGTGINIGMSTQFGKYFASGEKVQKSMEESAKSFGFNFNGKIGIQDGQASASFEFDNFPEKYGNILSSVIMNVFYTNVLERAVQAVPTFPMETSIGPVAINWATIFGKLLANLVEGLTNKSIGKLLPRDENDDLLVEPFSAGNSSHNSGVWSTMNTDSRTLDVAIEQYRIDGNFTDLWGQLKGNFDKLLNDLEQAAGFDYESALEQMDKIRDLANVISMQNDMLAYKAKVDEYNKKAIAALTNLGNWMNLWDHVADLSASSRNEMLASMGYNGSFDNLEENIISTWRSLVACYNSAVKDQKPSNLYADPRVSYQVYKPVIEFNITDKAASSSAFNSVDSIRNALVNLQPGSGKVTVNLLMDDRGNVSDYYGLEPSAYRMVDWSAYGLFYRISDLKRYADLYYDDWYDDNLTNEEKELILHKSKIQDLAYMDIGQNNPNVADGVGINYFIDSDLGTTNNSFYMHSATGGAFNEWRLMDGYWATDGIHANSNNELYDYYYEGTTYLGTFDENVKLQSTGTPTPVATSAVRTSSANANESRAQYAEDQSELHDLMTANTDTEYATEFAKHIITFRRLDAADDDEGDKALDKWITQTERTIPNGNHREQNVWEMSADAIDDLMASGSSAVRSYVLLTKSGTYDGLDTNNWGPYVGQASWTDWDVVKAFYEYDKMHYVMGFIAIITAVGVYMNFVFGLIQRAVNMAVLYIMSPITIAFYPFDNGQRFKNNFVMPFYKEAISAYAVIISLNLFVVLMAPVRSAAISVTNSSIVGFLTLVAFISMLPKIRDSICSILGANSMSSQSLTDTFNNAKKSIGSSLGDLANAGRVAGKGAVLARHGLQRGAEAVKPFISKLESKVNEGSDSFGTRLALRALGKNASIKERDARWQKNVDEALKTGDTTGLSAGERRRYERQRKTLGDKAEAKVLKNNPGVKKGTDEYSRLYEQERKNLLDQGKHKKSNYSVIEKGLSAAASAPRLVNAAPSFLAKKATGAASALGEKVKSSAKSGNRLAGFALGAAGGAKDLAQAASLGLKSTIPGAMVSEWWEENYGEFGKKLDDPKSNLGQFLAFHNRFKKVEDREKFGKELQKQERKRRDVNSKGIEAFTKGAEGQKEADKLVNDLSQQQLVEERLAAMGMSDADKTFNMAASTFMAKGMDQPAAEAAALERFKGIALQQEVNKASGQDMYMALQTEYWKGQGMSQRKAEAEAKKNYNDIMAHNNGADLNDRINDLGGANAYAALKSASMGNFDKQQFAQFAQSNPELMQNIFEQDGGMGKLAAGIAAGQKEFANFGINIDMDDADTKRKLDGFAAKIRQHMKDGSQKIKVELDTANKQRDEDAHATAMAVSQGLKLNLGSDEAKALEGIMKKANSSTSFEEMVGSIANATHKDSAEVRKELGAVYSDFAKNVQFNGNLRELQMTYDAAAALEKGMKDCISKLGDGVPVAAREAMTQAFMNLNDVNFSSANTESLGYKQNQILMKYNGDLTNKDCRAEMDAIATQMNSAVTLQFQEFMQKYGDTMREHDLKQKQTQEMNAVTAMSILPEIQKQIELNAAINLDVSAVNILNKDKMLQSIKEQGDYALAGQTVQLAVKAVMQHDDEALKNLKLDESTIEAFKRWESEGGESLKRLQGIAKYNEFVTAHMGTMSADMGGDTLQGVGAAMRNLYALSEKKIWLNQIQSTTQAWGQEEGHNRAIVNSMMNKIDSMFSSSAWNDLQGKITDMNGNMVNSAEELQAAMRATLDACNKNISNDTIRNNLKVFEAFRDANINNQTISNMADQFLNAISAASTANMLEGQVQSGRATASELNAGIAEISDKVKPFSSDGK